MLKGVLTTFEKEERYFMGVYINPGNSGFAEINDSDYMDKTGLIELINQTVEKKNKLTCISRPRRFGKSYAAKMLTAYYDCSCDSHHLFDDKKISKTRDYQEYLNRYNVIYLDITSFISEAKAQNQSLRDVPVMIQTAIKRDMAESGFDAIEEESLTEYLVRCVQKNAGRKFIFIIDEWDAMIREAKGNEAVQAIDNHDFDSYWTETSAAEGLLDYISRDYNGLTKTIAELIGGVDVKVCTTGFANDLTTFRGKDDILTLMVHLGYLAYDSVSKTVRIPNEEIKQEFQRSIREVKHPETIRRLTESDRLFADTIRKNQEAVAAQIEKVHAEETAALQYNKEESLRSVIKLAYYTYRDYYIQFEELPAGEGYADILYLPRPDSKWPPLVVELKWNGSAQGAIDQIRKKKYPSVLHNFGGPILLVGITYDKDADAGEKKHTCKIIEYRI